MCNHFSGWLLRDRAYLAGADLAGANLAGAHYPTGALPSGWVRDSSGHLLRDEVAP